MSTIDPATRPAAMGFHDGVVSLGVMMMTLLAGGSEPAALVRPGIAAAFAGAVSMSLGEWSSVGAAQDAGIRHESKRRAFLASFFSFALGSSVPVLVMWYGGGIAELVAASLSLIALASLVTGTNATRSLTVAVIATVASLAFGHATR
ncbi:MAG: VIT1/CCC1 transporter family protein [Pontimonas sp.]